MHGIPIVQVQYAQIFEGLVWSERQFKGMLDQWEIPPYREYEYLNKFKCNINSAHLSCQPNLGN